MTLTHPLAAEPPATTFHLLNHYFSTVEDIDEGLLLAPNRGDPDDRAIVQRLLNIYRRMQQHESLHIPPEQRPNQGVWEMMRHEFHGEIYRLLHDGDVEALDLYFRNALRERVAVGLGPGQAAFAAFNGDRQTQILQVMLIRDRLVSLATSIGVLALENPEQGPYGLQMLRSSADLIRRTQVALGTEIWRPPVMGLFGLEFDGKVVDIRAPDDAYCANALCALVPNHRRGVLAEIGGGFGGLALQAIRVGFERVFVFDLPLMTLLQGYFLMKVLGPDRVCMLGEEQSGRSVVLLPYWEFVSDAHRFDVVVNRDSLPEMPLAAGIGYLREIERRGIPILSINQETKAESGQENIRQIRVAEVAKTYTSLVRHSRTLYWLRKGYVEEVYRPREG